MFFSGFLSERDELCKRMTSVSGNSLIIQQVMEGSLIEKLIKADKVENS